MSSGNSLGGGSSRGNVKNKKTYIGMDAGRNPGILDQLLTMYAGGGQQANAQNDLLFGGKNYGSAGRYFGAPAGGGGAGGGGNGSQASAMAQVGGDDDGSGGGAWGESPWNELNDPDGTHRQAEYIANNPQYDPNKSGQATPDGGLVGTYQGMEDNPWQTGPNGDNETDALGSYDWMASGARNADESDVYGGLGDIGQGWDQFGQKTGTDTTREGIYGDLSGAGPNALEQGEADAYGDLAGGPNANERGTYADTTLFGKTPGQDVSKASGAYSNMVDNGGYDDATKAAMTTENLNAARAPFETARENIARAASSRNNPSAAIGAQIALARDESKGVGSASRQNLIDQAQEKIRQRQVGAEGLQGTQGITNAAQEYALSQRAGQNATLAGQKAAGAAGLGSASRDITGRRATGAAGLGNVQGQMDARQKAALEGGQSTLGQMAGENTKQRNLALQGTQGKEGMFNTMFGRRQAGTAGKQHLYDTGQQQRAGDLAGLGNVGGKTAVDYVESGTGGGGL